MNSNSHPSSKGIHIEKAPDEIKSAAADIVQFACPLCYCLESEGKVVIEIMRLGHCQGDVHVTWHTEDLSGKAGARYIANSGKVTFADGEDTKSIIIDILVLEEWCPTLEFKVRLSAPQNCNLGLYLQACTVKVIDDDVFPSDKYRPDITKRKEGVRDVNWIGLFAEFVIMIFHQRDIHWKTIVTLVFDQMQNIYMFLKLTMQAYLVNVVLNTHDSTTAARLLVVDNRVATACVIGAGYIIPMLFLHLWDYLRIKMDIEGHTQVFLSSCLFCTYLNYSEHSRQYVRPAEMQLGLLGEARDLAIGYSLILDMAQMIGKLFMLIFFVVLREPSALWIVACMPALMACFGFLRGSSIASYRREKDRREREVIGIIAQTCDKYLTIRHYFRRSAREEIYRSKADETRKAECPVKLVMNNNLYAAKWLGPVFVGLYIVLSAPQVLSQNLQLGIFLATISILGSMSDLFLDVYTVYQRIAEMAEPLNTLCIYFNLATDLRDFKLANEDQMHWFREARKDVMNGPPPPPEANMMRTDLIPIILDGLTFNYGQDIIVQNANITAMQGSMVAVTGNHGSGKATLLQLLGRTMVPNMGSVLIPPHLRVLFVSQEPCILLDLTLWENLTMGCPSAVDYGLTISILQELGMERLLDALKHFKDGPQPVSPKPSMDQDNSSRDLLLGVADDSSPEQKHEEAKRKKHMARWFEKLNSSEKAKIHLARALIMNPEVMVMHRPLLHYDDLAGRRVLSIIKHHHHNRGICMPVGTLGRRRPRTVFMTTDAAWQEAAADIIWHIDAKSKKLSAHEPSHKPSASEADVQDQPSSMISARHFSTESETTPSSTTRTTQHGAAAPQQQSSDGANFPVEGNQAKRHCSSGWMADMDWCFSPQSRHVNHVRPPATISPHQAF